jgi:hypothetical protein
VSRYRVTETRQIIVDSDWYYDPESGDEEDAAVEYARDLPSDQWDTLATEVKGL